MAMTMWPFSRRTGTNWFRNIEVDRERLHERIIHRVIFQLDEIQAVALGQAKATPRARPIAFCPFLTLCSDAAILYLSQLGPIGL